MTRAAMQRAPVVHLLSELGEPEAPLDHRMVRTSLLNRNLRAASDHREAHRLPTRGDGRRRRQAENEQGTGDSGDTVDEWLSASRTHDGSSLKNERK